MVVGSIIRLWYTLVRIRNLNAYNYYYLREYNKKRAELSLILFIYLISLKNFTYNDLIKE